MPSIQSIPEQYKSGFTKIGDADDHTFDSIKEGLSLSSLVSSLSTLVKKITDVTNLQKKDIQDIFYSVGSLISFIENEDEIKNIVENIVNIATEKELVKKENIDRFINRLTFLLTNKHIYYASKGNILKSEYGYVFIGSKIVSDIRPVFDINIEETPKGAMIIHTLHLHYQADKESDHKDIFLALDSHDLKELKEAIARADRKEISLQKVLTKAEITNLNE